MTNLTDMLSKFVNSSTASTSGSGSLPSNTITNPKVDLKGITTRSGVAYQGPTIPTTTSSPFRVVERETEVTKDTVPPTNNGSTKDVQPPVAQVQPHVLNFEPVVAPVSAPMPNLKPTIPYPLRRNDERRREKANDQIEKFYKIFKYLIFEISLTDALILMPKFASTFKSLIGNKEKLSEMARTPLNEHCSAVILNKLPEKLGDPGKFLIPCDFPRMDECLALADLGASINLMPLSVQKKLSLPELTLTCMTLELADRSITQPIGIAEDVDVKTGRALIDVYEGELTLCVRKEAVTFNLDQTSRYSFNYDDNSVNQIEVIEMACEEYSQEVLDFSDEVDAFLRLEDVPTSTEIDDSYYDPEGDILLLESFLTDDPSLPPPTQENYFPEIRKELKVCEAKNDKSSIDEPPVVELKDLPPHLEYAFFGSGDEVVGDDEVMEVRGWVGVVVAVMAHGVEMVTGWREVGGSDCGGSKRVGDDPKTSRRGEEATSKCVGMWRGGRWLHAEVVTALAGDNSCISEGAKTLWRLSATGVLQELKIYADSLVVVVGHRQVYFGTYQQESRTTKINPL
ncbi:reverse transcriptase domain-containing protein [Tanacetum coccineum]